MGDIKMANGHGGSRQGSGAKKKPLAEKLLHGNPSRRKIEYLDFGEELKGQDMPEPKEYLSARQKDGTNSRAKEIYEETWQWLDGRNCTNLINPQLLESYAMATARWLQCEGCKGTVLLHPFVFYWYNIQKAKQVIIMPRRAREKSESGIYHVMLRGANKQEIFQEDNLRFIETLEKYKKSVV